MIGIYKITNLINNKKYYGSSADIKTRWRKHKSQLKSNTHGNKHLQRSWNKHGKEGFSFEIILLCEKFELEYYEQWFLDNVVRWGVDYNVAECAKAFMRGRVHTEKSKLKMSVSRSGSKNHMYGKTHTEETKRKISEARVGKYCGVNSPMYGKIFSDEHKRNLSRAKLGTKQSKETIEKRKKTFRNIKLSLGEDNMMAILTEKKVLKIRKLLKETNRTQADIGQEYGVSSQTISLINIRKTWKHI